MCVCPFDWTHMCSPAVLGLQEHLKTTFNPARPALHTHKYTRTHTIYCRQRAGAALPLAAILCVHVCVYVSVCEAESEMFVAVSQLLCYHSKFFFFPCKFTFVICLYVLSCALLKTQM